MRLYATEVAPRLKALTADYDPHAMEAKRAATPDRQTADVDLMAAHFVR